MGTRGYKAWRFRKRYYYHYNRYDSYPGGLGQELADGVPSISQEYSAWLEDQRKMVAKWEAQWDEYLAVDPSSDNPLELPDHLPEFMIQEQPGWMVPLNDLYIEWVYILDLDREVFSVNNGAHFKLDRISHIDWTAALADGGRGDKIVLPGMVPEDAVVNLVVDPHQTYSSANTSLEKPTTTQSSDLTHRLVTAKNLRHFPWRHRHGPMLRSFLFYLLRERMKEDLAAALLQWSPQDLPFREIAFAILCLALGGKHLTVILARNLKANFTFGLLGSRSQPSKDLEFISGLATGAHVRGATPGSSPEGVIYWLEGVLVILTTQLYRPGVVNEEVSRVANYCQDNNPNECIDAILMSIEHVVLIHVVPNKEVQHSALLPLLQIPNHLSMDAKDRYPSWYLEKLASKEREFMKKEEKKLHKAANESMRKQGLFMPSDNLDEGEEESLEEEEFALYDPRARIEGCECSTFYALNHIFDAAARRRMSCAKAKDGRFPNEIYANILEHVTDMETRHSCMEVSRVFRELCQEDLLFADGMIFKPSEACKTCVEPHNFPKSFDVYNIASGARSEVSLKRTGKFRDYEMGPTWTLGIGTGHSKKSLLRGLEFRFQNKYLNSME